MASTSEAGHSPHRWPASTSSWLAIHRIGLLASTSSWLVSALAGQLHIRMACFHVLLVVLYIHD
jgi:hypothetical protein